MAEASAIETKAIVFWDLFRQQLPIIERIRNGDRAAFCELNFGEIPVNLEIMIGQINCQTICKPTHLEIYISPKSKKHINIMKEIYDYKPQFDSISFVMFRAFHITDEIASQIEYRDYIIKYDDIVVHSMLVTQNNMLYLDIILAIKPAAAHILKRFSVDDSKTHRTIWCDTTNATSLFLLQTLGETALLNYVRAVEKFPSTSKIINSLEFQELLSLRDYIPILEKSRNIHKCQYCSHSNMNVKLYRCSRCKTTRYCSVACQKADTTHATVCK